MPHDHRLAALLAAVDETQAAHDRALAALRAYVNGSGPSGPDLVPLKDAATEFRKSIDTVRRWATEEELGEQIDGRWYLSRTLVRKYKPKFFA